MTDERKPNQPDEDDQWESAWYALSGQTYPAPIVAVRGSDVQIWAQPVRFGIKP